MCVCVCVCPGQADFRPLLGDVSHQSQGQRTTRTGKADMQEREEYGLEHTEKRRPLSIFSRSASFEDLEHLVDSCNTGMEERGP